MPLANRFDAVLLYDLFGYVLNTRERFVFERRCGLGRGREHKAMTYREIAQTLGRHTERTYSVERMRQLANVAERKLIMEESQDPTKDLYLSPRWHRAELAKVLRSAESL